MKFQINLKSNKSIYYLFIISVLIAAIIAVKQYHESKGYISNDSTQYLAGAESLISEGSFSTRILYFDEHYTTGTIPAPQTVWPPGLSMAIASLSLFGIDIDTAGQIVSMLAFVLLVGSVCLLSWKLAHSMTASTVAVIWQLICVDFWRYSGGIGSDLIFTALSTICMLIYVAAVEKNNAYQRSFHISFPALMALSVLSGIGFIFRYPGVFLIAWVMLLILVEFVGRLRRNPKSWVRDFFYSSLAALPALLCFAVLIGRNLIITGGIQGGNNKTVYNSVFGLGADTIKSFVTVLTGVNQSNFFEASLFLGILGGLALLFLLAGIAISAYKIGQSVLQEKFNNWKTQCHIAILVFIGIYIVGIIIVSSRTFASFGSRYLLSAMPLLIVVVISCWNKFRWATWLGVFLVAGTQFVFYQAYLIPPSSPKADHESAYSEMATWIDENTNTKDTILVVGDGQRIGYHSNRSAATVPIRHFSAYVWDEKRFKKIINDYNIKIIVASKNDTLNDYEEFSAQLMQGQENNWVSLSANTGNSFIYTVNN
ncbi:glycosyltransferase family protein [Aurantivibrio infirmus]